MENFTDERNQAQPFGKSANQNIEPKSGTTDFCENHVRFFKNGRMFVISDYYEDDEGKFKPELPDRGSCHTSDECPCRICVQHYRERKTGPPFNLLVAECKTHEIAFTIYPPGYAPYGRQLLAPVAPDGDLIKEEKDTPRFEGTYFEAAIDAANFDFWPESHAGNTMPRRITQKRHLDRAALILGVAPGLHERVREELAQILSLPGQLLHDGAVLIKKCPGVQNLGKAIRGILNVIDQCPSIFERLAEAGAKVGLWPPPKRWDSCFNIFRPSPHLSEIT